MFDAESDIIAAIEQVGLAKLAKIRTRLGLSKEEEAEMVESIQELLGEETILG